MEGEKQASSSSSLPTQLFGSKEQSPSSSSALFDSIFPPPSKAHRRDYISYEETKKNNDSNTKRDCLNNEGKSPNQKTDMSQFYQQEVSQPCHLSSSIYYGGQDIYINPRKTKNTPGHSTQYSKDGEDDGLASRGNWWQGSLYY
ncbi:hypothetical protein L1987_59877 [Smallanthus sonchifolius]|uniref:Uncharacterized protein n=1 Tax=Smallanthus sonchifolius TaxID=185202 RepID=A0ACB9D7B8_9ASTR|nr:hypothetical protein L1987_59877 [Smallanthus sonchifolius]